MASSGATVVPAQQSMASGSDPFWYDAPDVWDALTIGGQRVPGITKIRGKYGRKLQVNSPPGADGASIRDRGYNPAKFTATVMFWTADQYSQMQSLMPMLNKFSGQRTALSVSNPVLKMAGITQAYLENVGIVQDGSVRGSKEIELEFIQLKAITNRPAGAVQPNQSFIQADALTQQQNPTSSANTPSTNGAGNPPASLQAPGQ